MKSAGTVPARLWRRCGLGLWRRFRRGNRRTSSATIYHENNEQDRVRYALGLFDSARILFDRLRGTLAARVQHQAAPPKSCLCYSSGGAMNVTLSTTVTLNGAGVYIFRPGGALNTGANSMVILAGGACASDVFWAPVGATTLGANAALSPTPTFVGNILDAAGVTIGHFANLTGRALAFGGTVTTDADTITVPTCAPFAGGGTNIPALSEWAMVMLAGLLAIAGFAAMRRKAS